MIFFSYLRVFLYIPFLDVLTVSGASNFCSYQLSRGEVVPDNFCFILSLPTIFTFVFVFVSLFHIILFLIVHFFIFLSLFHVIFFILMHLSLFLPPPLPHHLCPTCEPLYLPLTLTHHLGPPCTPLSFYIPFHLPKPPYLYQILTCCHSYTNMIQLIQFI